MTRTRRHRWLRLACWLTLLGLSSFCWSVLDPRPVPVMVAMSIGQVIGTFASLIFLVIVVADLRTANVLKDDR